MALRYDEKFWWQYLPPNIIEGFEGWMGVDFDFEPIQFIKEL